MAACFLLALALEASAYSDVRFEHLSLEHGLAQSAVQDLVSDDLGFMWFGTQYGLSRYDGYGFRNFRHRPQDPGTLSDSRIQDLLKSRDGRLWVATASGVDRLDPATLRIERIALAGGNELDGIASTFTARQLAEDRHGNLVAAGTRGLWVLRSDGERLRRVRREGSSSDFWLGQLLTDSAGRIWFRDLEGLWRLRSNLSGFRLVAEFPADTQSVRKSSLALMPDGNLALATPSGVVVLDPRREVTVDRVRPSQYGHEDDWVGAVAADPRGIIWLMTREALVQFEPDSERWETRFIRWRPADAREQLDYDLAVGQDDQDFVWVGLPEIVGLSSPDGRTFRVLRHDPDKPHSLMPSPADSVKKMYQDDFGVIWIGGGLGGLSRFAPQSTRFELVRDSEIHGFFGTDNVIRSVLEQRSGGREFLWTGLNSGGIRVWERREGRFSFVSDRLHSLARPGQRLPNNTVWSLAEDPVSGHVWAGMDNGIAVVSAQSREVLAVPLTGKEDGSKFRVVDMLFSGDGDRLLVATSRALFNYRLDADRTGLRLHDSIQLPPTDPAGHCKSVTTHSLQETARGAVLVATQCGIVRWNPETGATERHFPAGDSGLHPRNEVFHLIESPEGVIWAGTQHGGLGRVRLHDDGFSDWTWLDEDDGLPDRTVYALAPDKAGSVWLSSNRGLARLNPESGVVRRFSLDDGLQSLEFNNTVVARGESGRLYFGGINGVNVFRPERIEPHPEPPRIYLERAVLAGESVTVNARSPTVLSTEHDRNSLELEFVGLHFSDPASNQYAYRLEGADPDWVETGDGRVVRYPDLAPGDYRFVVRAANGDGVWSRDRHLLSIEVGSPPWMTPWAWLLYAFATVGLISMFVLVERGRRRRLEQVVATRTRELREQKELVDRQAGELEEVLDARTTLFANISHEFRTPLTLIEASIDRLSRNPDDAGAKMAARRYLRRLLRLVDQLLNLSRLQSPREQPAPEPWSIDQFVTMTVEAFKPLAEQRGIALEAAIEERWLTQCHQADVERILLNLIGNALKYCPSGSTVRVSVVDGDGGVWIIVCDDGPGIPEDQKELIFQRFSRMPAHERGRIQGAGIGLTLVREAARSNGGHVELSSEPGQGAEFRVWLPAWRGHMQGAPVNRPADQRLELELESLEAEASGFAPGSVTEPPASGPGCFGVALIAEDNLDLRRHLSEALSGEWETLEAEDGAQALHLARERLPDVVVSDIMMPQMDGLQLLKRLREDVRTSHLPVLLLTARQDDATRLQGFSLSADDFLAKPFNPAELRLRLRRIVDMRARIQARLWRQLEISGQGGEPAESAEEHEHALPDLSERDQQLLERVRNWLEVNFEDPEAGVAELAQFVAMEQRTLQRKLKALTGRSPAAHLQQYRLECARQLLVESDRSVQDIALSCGFSSPQYFSRVFARQEGLSPSKWRRQQP